MVKIERILSFLEEAFQYSSHPDYPQALNGLQVEGKPEIRRLVAAVDASEETIKEAVRRGADLLLVHHGLFWGGLGPLTGPRFRKVAALVEGRLALVSLHLPLDAHPDLGNNILLLRRLGLEPGGRFGLFHQVPLGWWGSASLERRDLVKRLEEVVEGKVRVVEGGPPKVSRVGVLSGAGSSALEEAAGEGLDTLVTGEAPHHAYHDAMELGLNLLLAGHYATETLGIRAVTQRLAEEFELDWDFLHFPTGL
jgi:dinuclear metal center YbgI/SA1388 family protein